MVKGIGPFCAKVLVAAFGTEVFSVIENEPERLKGLRGIGPKRIEKITSWAGPTRRSSARSWCFCTATA